jgi:hypothetical protein
MDYFATVSIRSPHTHVHVNFGQQSFVFSFRSVCSIFVQCCCCECCECCCLWTICQQIVCMCRYQIEKAWYKPLVRKHIQQQFNSLNLMKSIFAYLTSQRFEKAYFPMLLFVIEGLLRGGKHLSLISLLLLLLLLLYYYL